MNPLHQKRPRPIDSPRGGYFPQPDSYVPLQVPLPSTPTSVVSMGSMASLGPPYMPTPPTSSPHPAPGGAHGSSSSFRNVSACNRCRLRKNRCDQQLPACSSCEKAHVKCVGYDPITKREIPRAYVYYLERRTAYLEGLLRGAGIPYAPPEDFDVGPEDAHAQPTKQGVNQVGTGDIATRRGGFGAQGQGAQQSDNVLKLRERSLSPVSPRTTVASSVQQDEEKKEGERHNIKTEPSEDEKLDKLVSNIGLVSVQGASDPRYLGSASGISFARVVFAAVRSSISGQSGEPRGRNGVSKLKDASSPSAREGGGAAAAVSGSSMRDSFFGLQSRPAFKKAAFPDRELGNRLVDLYFEHANPQIPILHRGEFMSLFEKAYAAVDRKRTARELYMLNIVFAIGASIFLGAPDGKEDTSTVKQETLQSPVTPAAKRFKFERTLTQPEEYHASAMAHLENFLGSAPASDRPEGFGGSLEELQAVLLLAEFALHRPVAPGLWYIVGVAVRLAVDLGLHHEDGTALDDSPGDVKSVALSGTGFHPRNVNLRERGRREWVRDLRRRLWWCTYSFDRLVSTCVGRPFGITDLIVTTEFPSLLDDRFITTSGFVGLPDAEHKPSYKRVAHHYFRLRLLQSEILQVLQHRSAQQARSNRVEKRGGAMTGHDSFLDDLQTPFLQRFDNNFSAWRKDVDKRLYEWKKTTPSQAETEVQFTTDLLELNYWQTVIMLYRQSLTVPPELHRDATTADEVTSPMSQETKGGSDDPEADQETEEEIFLKVAEASQKVLYLYKKLHRVRLVNYTFLATHNLFMAGIAFLYALWHSHAVRAQLLFEEVDLTILAATSVLTDLIETCAPAEACRDAFDRMAKATVKMCNNTTGFGSARPQEQRPQISQQHSAPGSSYMPQVDSLPHQFMTHAQSDIDVMRSQRPRPHFDMNLRELFPDETQESRQFRRVSVWQMPYEDGGQEQGQPMSTQATTAPMLSSQGMQAQVNFGAQPVAHFQGNEQAMQAQRQQQQHQHQQQQQQALYAQMQQQQAQSIPIHQAMGAPPSSFPGNFMPGQGFDPNMNTYRNDIDSLLAESTQSYTGHPGLSLGFDSEHDWNDGAGVDLFEGYFFGGWNGQMQPMQGQLHGQPGMAPGPMDMQMDGIGPRDM